MADITRETVEALAEKVETFAAGLPPEERTILMTALSKATEEVDAFASLYTTPMGASLASSIGLKPGGTMNMEVLSASQPTVPFRIAMMDKIKD